MAYKVHRRDREVPGQGEVWLAVALATTFALFTGATVTITSSPQSLGVDTVCDNQDVTLMCHTDQTTGNMITWYWYNQSQHGGNITVVATMTRVVYTCVVSKDGHHLEDSKVTVVANGSQPVFLFCNFLFENVTSPTIRKQQGENLTLFCIISSDFQIYSGFPKWIRFPGYLPPNAMDNYTADGKQYNSTLSLYELSFEDDSGNYTNIVSNQCGTSSVSVYIDVRKAPIMCNNSGSLVGRQKSILTVIGELITLQCFFEGNVKLLGGSLFVSWEVSYSDSHQPQRITDNSTNPYRIAVYQTCLSEDGSCCKFVNQLTILDTSSEMNDTSLTCIAAIDEHQVSSVSKMTIFTRPRLKSTSQVDTQATVNSTVMLQCQFTAPTNQGVTIVVWQHNNVPIDNSTHHSIKNTVSTGIDVVTSTLTINSVTKEDDGTFCCYCQLNESMVTSHKPVLSDFGTLHLNVGEGSGGDSGNQTVLTIIGSVFGFVGIIICFGAIYYYARKKCKERDTERQRLLNADCQNSDENIPERRPVEATRQPGQ